MVFCHWEWGRISAPKSPEKEHWKQSYLDFSSAELSMRKKFHDAGLLDGE